MINFVLLSDVALGSGGTISSQWIDTNDILYSNVGVIAGADVGGSITVEFSNDGSNILVQSTVNC
ncbi:MAG: hypothetical protein QW478_14935, partial [Candidatus Micrarchaeaceae archaeon]